MRDAPSVITTNDIYAFEGNVVIAPAEIEDLVGRHFRQPEEGLGFDKSAFAHMWRSMICPTISLTAAPRPHEAGGRADRCGGHARSFDRMSAETWWRQGIKAPEQMLTP